MLQSDPETLDRIYEAGVFPELWPSVLDHIGHLVGADGGFLFPTDGGAGELAGSQRVLPLRASDRFAPLTQVLAHEDWSTRNICLARLLERRPPGFVGDLELLSHEEMDSHPLYNEVLRPLGLAWAAGTLIRLPGGEMTAIVFGRGTDAGPLSLSAVQLLNSLRPHLAQAIQVSFRVQLRQARATVELLDDLGLAAAIIGRSGSVVATNTAFGKLGAQFVMRAKGTLSIACASANRQFQDAIGAIDVPPGARSISIPATEEDAALVINLLPLRHAARDIHSNARCLMVVTTVGARPSPSADLLQGLFGLTPAETLLAQALVQGETLSSYARKRDLSKATLRTHLKAIFAKTGTNRQASLVSLLSGL